MIDDTPLTPSQLLDLAPPPPSFTNDDLVTVMVALQNAIAEAKEAKRELGYAKASADAAERAYLNKMNIVRTLRADLELLTEKLTT